MRRLASHLFTLCSALSLLLCVAVCVLWARSYWRDDTLLRVRFDNDDRRLFSRRGWVGWGTDPQVYDGQLYRWQKTVRRVFNAEMTTQLDRPPDGNRSMRVPQLPPQLQPVYSESRLLPHAALAAITAAPPVMMVIRFRRRRRRSRRHLCSRCGYDLRAHRKGDQCPECGTPTT